MNTFNSDLQNLNIQSGCQRAVWESVLERVNADSVKECSTEEI